MFLTRRSKIVSRTTGRRAVMSVDHLWCGVVQKRNAKDTKVLVSNVASLLSFPRVSSRGTSSLSKQMLFFHSVHMLCSLVTRLISGLILVRHSLNHLNLLLFSAPGKTRFEINAHYTRHLLEWVYRERCVGLYV